ACGDKVGEVHGPEAMAATQPQTRPKSKSVDNRRRLLTPQHSYPQQRKTRWRKHATAVYVAKF
ncbi:hypothetical protein, partial [Corynebacterium afermentans]|uniref:hypothetical protein n=1 Tax=Corynebacterium afermentans TaxID=38286 RepID=UPI002572941C